MSIIDYVILIIYASGMLLIGSILSRWNKSSADMFSVSRQSPWWLSGISSFMSAFSAGTFVVWGGIAYKHGAVSISILMCLGISSFIVGKMLAGRWAKLGVATVGEYIKIRFGEQLVQFYTWVGMAFKFVAMSVALYAFATLFCTLVPLPEGNMLRDAATGHLSITYACIISGLIMLFYTVSGGLWAVLIIDAVQFVILMITVIFVVPLSFEQAGGITEFIAKAPEGFLSPAGGKFTYWFLIGWIIIHVFKLGGEWVFVQRFLAVSTPRAAKKSAYLLGAMYLICPIIWMLPAMIYRTVDAGADPEQAYFLACASVLPAGMMGLLLASMFSAAASSVGGEVNVYAGALTNDFYKTLIRPKAGDRELVVAGRIFATLIGLAIIGGAISIPYVGGAENVILTLTSLLVVPMALPTIWGLFFGRSRNGAVWCAMGLSFLAAFILKVVLPEPSGPGFLQWIEDNSVAMEVGVGVLVPLITMIVFELAGRKVSPGFTQIKQMSKVSQDLTAKGQIVVFPARLLAYSIGLLSLVMYALAAWANDKAWLMAGFGAALSALCAFILLALKKMKPNNNIQ